MSEGGDNGIADALLDGALVGPPEETRMLPIVQLLITVFLRELAAWSVALFAVLVVPLFVPQDRFQNMFLVSASRARLHVLATRV